MLSNGATMTNEKLIKELRDSKGWPNLGNAAADRIEELESKVKQLGNESMFKYLVVWKTDYGVVQSVVETDKNPSAITEFDWVRMAAEAEEIELKDSQSYDLFLVINYPEKFYI